MKPMKPVKQPMKKPVKQPMRSRCEADEAADEMLMNARGEPMRPGDRSCIGDEGSSDAPNVRDDESPPALRRHRTGGLFVGGVTVLVAALCASGAVAASDASPRLIAAIAAKRPASKAAPRAAGTSTKKPAPPHSVPAPAIDYAKRRDVLDYVDTLVEREHFDRDALLRTFADARYSATAVRLMTPASSTSVRRDWAVYRARFVEPVRLAAGLRFWDDNAALLARAESEFGVPAEIVVGILGVETVYGRNTGTFRVIDALTTLAFDYPQGPGTRQRDRSAFFREQLTDALRLARDGGADLAMLRGSYAGAIGMPQFMPGSIRQHAIDYDGDGRIDLVGSVADVIGSVAHFLAEHGWVRGQPTCAALIAPPTLDAMQAARIDAMVDAGSVPTLSYGDLAAVGFALAAPMAGPLALIDLPSGVDAAGRPITAYLAGTQNFHVVTRYNRSYFYAYSVIELGSTIKALRDARM